MGMFLFLGLGAVMFSTLLGAAGVVGGASVLDALPLLLEELLALDELLAELLLFDLGLIC